MTTLQNSSLAAIDALIRVDPAADAPTRRIYATVLRLPPDRLAQLIRDASHEGQEARPAPRLLRRAEVARRLSLSLRAVDKLAAAGVLPKFRLPGRTRAAGFMENELADLMHAGAASGRN